MSRWGVRGAGVDLLCDRFLREADGSWLDLATGLSVDVSTESTLDPGATLASLTRERGDAWLPAELPVLVAEAHGQDGRPFTARRRRQPGEQGTTWRGTTAAAADVRRISEALDGSEPGHVRVVQLRAPVGAALEVAERAAGEAQAKGFAVVGAAVAAAHPDVLRAWRGRSLVILAADEAQAGPGTAGAVSGAALIACSPARVAAVVRVSASDPASAVASITGTATRVGQYHPRAARLLARRRFAASERWLRRRAFMSGDGSGSDEALDAALLLAERERHRGKATSALSIALEVARGLTRAHSSRAALDVAAMVGCLRTDLVRLAEARDGLVAAWAASLALAGRPHDRCGVMLARCCAWQGEFDRASDVLDRAAVDGQTDDATAARWYGLRVRVALARGDICRAHRVLHEAMRARRWLDPVAVARVSAEAITVHAVLASVDDVVRAAGEATRAAARANSVLAGATVRAALLDAWRQLGQRRRQELPARWLRRHRSSLPPLVRWRVDQALAGVGARPVRRMVPNGLARGVTAPFAALQSGRRSDVVEEFVDVLQICHDTDDERDALKRVCTLLRSRLGAVAVGFDDQDGTPLARASATSRVAFSLAERAVSTGSAIPPFEVDAGLETAAAVRYGGLPIAALCARWCLDDRPDAGRAVALLTAAAAAAAPAVRTVLDRRALEARERTDDLDIVGNSRAIDDLRQRVRQVAQVPFPVLIEGESGSGKELVARALHRAGSRRQRRFCAINCAALTDDLLEAELFGHTRGAFTGAVTERAGVFEEADGGTLFLDEVTELSPRAQAKLLRVIQEGEVRRVGENIARRVDTRIVAATNRSLSQEVDRGRFRDDLRYRLDVVRLVLPPLRERREDIGLLAACFWKEAAARAGSQASLAPETLAVLAQHDWPGNVRELQNVMALLALSAPRRGRVAAGLLPPSVRTPGPAAAAGPARLDAARRSFEQAFVRDALARNSGRRGRTARDLGVTRQGLAKLLTRLGLAEQAGRAS